MYIGCIYANSFKADQQDSLDLSVVTPSTTEEQEIDTEKQTKVTESAESTAATESVSSIKSCIVDKSTHVHFAGR